MTAIGMFSQPFNTSNRVWLLDDHGTEIAPGVGLDLTAFTQAQHYPNGFIPDGVVVGLNTTSQKYGPYLGSASDGRQNAVGITLDAVSVYQPGGGLYANVVVPILIHGFVDANRLPLTSANAANGGYLDAAARTALRNLVFVPAAP